MLFWWGMFFCNLLYPAAMILGGWMMWKHPPKKINAYCGYRSRWSKKSIDTWRFAHAHCGKRWWKIGWMMLAPTVLAQLPFWGRNADIVGTAALVICIADCSVLLLSILPTEKALRERFHEDGTPKQQESG